MNQKLAPFSTPCLAIGMALCFLPGAALAGPVGPWGIVIAPSSFGSFSNDLLVGNFGNGEINAFNPASGAFLGVLTGTGGTPFVNQDLWALAVTPLAPNTVYFTAGINGQKDGLFGDIAAAPEPGSLALAGLGCLALVLFSRRKLVRQ